MKRVRFFLPFLVVFTILLLDIFPWLDSQPAASQPAPSYLAGLRGLVSDQNSGLPITSAHITVLGTGASAKTQSDGTFFLEKLAIPQETLPVTVTVSAAGFGSWSIQNVRLVSADVLILTPNLGRAPQQINFAHASQAGHTTYSAAASRLPVGQELRLSLAPHPANSSSGLLLNTSWEIPTNIRVRVTGGDWPCDPNPKNYTVQTVDFKSYVKHVLPSEWDGFGRLYPEALRAGAVAIKMYAWYWIDHGGKWPDADVVDNTCDQWYRPEVAYASTDKAVEDTWPWILIRYGELFQTRHKQDCQPPYCMSQQGSVQKAQQSSTWDQILAAYYPGSSLTYLAVPPAGFDLRFYGSPRQSGDRVLIPLYSQDGWMRSLPANVGSGDFTFEWWQRAFTSDNTAGKVTCGPGEGWKNGNVLIDQGRPGTGERRLGVSLAGGHLAFGISGESISSSDPDASFSGISFTLCGQKNVADGYWHHIAVERRRSDGRLRIFVDGQLDTSAAGPLGDISYPADPGAGADPDAVIVLGANRSAAAGTPGFNGWIDELRISNSVRYESHFQVQRSIFASDQNTMVLYHFDEGYGSQVVDSSGVEDGPVNGKRQFGGLPNGPDWQPSGLIGGADGPFRIFIPTIRR